MTEALDAMVKAIKAELLRQGREDAGADYADEGAREWIMTLDGHFDIEKVARAGLLAIRKPTTGVILAGADVPDSVHRFWPPMIDEILK